MTDRVWALGCGLIAVLLSVAPVAARTVDEAAAPLPRAGRADPAISAQAGQLQGDTGRAALIRSLDSIAALPVQAGRTAGVSVAVVRGRDTLLLRHHGRADVAAGTPVTGETVHEIGSVTKQFTAAAVLQLAEQGRLSLDDDVSRWLPEYPTGGRRVTIRRLLDHTAGVPGFSLQVPEYQSLLRLSTQRELPRDTLLRVSAAEPFDFEPGTALVYSNSGYFLLGEIIERASGSSYEEYLESRIFGPLGMTASSHCAARPQAANRARGYTASGGTLEPSEQYDPRLIFAAGALCATAGDLLSWLQALHGGRVLGPEAYREMITPDTLAHGHRLRYAKGLLVQHDPSGHRLIGHGGTLPGFIAEARYYPEPDLYIVVLTNTLGPPGAGAMADALAARVLGTAEPVRFAAETAGLDALVGRYSGPARNEQLTVDIEGGADGLTVRIRNAQRATPIRHLGNDVFAVATPAGQAGVVRFMFMRGPGGSVTLHFDQGDGHFILQRQE